MLLSSIKESLNLTVLNAVKFIVLSVKLRLMAKYRANKIKKWCICQRKIKSFWTSWKEPSTNNARNASFGCRKTTDAATWRADVHISFVTCVAESTDLVIVKISTKIITDHLKGVRFRMRKMKKNPMEVKKKMPWKNTIRTSTAYLMIKMINGEDVSEKDFWVIHFDEKSLSLILVKVLFIGLFLNTYSHRLYREQDTIWNQKSCDFLIETIFLTFLPTQSIVRISLN